MTESQLLLPGRRLALRLPRALLGAEEPDRELNATRGLATHEMVVRAQYKAWVGYMREAA